MQRDMDLVRQVLEEIEAHRDQFKFWEVEIDGRDPQDVAYQVQLLYEGGFIDAEDLTSMGSPYRTFSPKRLTWQGHEMLDAIRNDNVWSEIKQKAKEQGGSLPLEIIKQLGNAILKKKLGLS
jgi:hypothetical protein